MGCNHSRESVAPRVYAVEEVQHSPVHRAEADAEGFMSITRKLEADFGSSPAERSRRPDFGSRSAAQDQAFEKWLARQRMMHERRRTHLPSSPDDTALASPEAPCAEAAAVPQPIEPSSDVPSAEAAPAPAEARSIAPPAAAEPPAVKAPSALGSPRPCAPSASRGCTLLACDVEVVSEAAAKPKTLPPLVQKPLGSGFLDARPVLAAPGVTKLPAPATRPVLGDVSNSGSEPGSSAHQKPSAVPVSSAPAAVEWSLQQ